MGDIADYMIESALNEMMFEDMDCPAPYEHEHILDSSLWWCDDRYNYPKDLSEGHLRNIMKLLVIPDKAGDLQVLDTFEYMELTVEQYIEQRIKTSLLWQTLTEALKPYKLVTKKANDLNKGVLEI